MRRLAILSILLIPGGLYAQVEVRDTLRESIITAVRRSTLMTGELRTDMEGMKAAASPLGEGDPIRWIQYLPGVTAGADGTSAAFVRGGNLGGNLLTLDGVPVHGYSHVLGLTTVIPTEEIESVSFAKGGFGGNQGNFTSSHIAVSTRQPAADCLRTSLFVNNFLAGGSMTGPLSDKLSFSLSARVSPLSLEYRTLKGLMGSGLGSLKKFNAGVGDLYGNLHWVIGSGRTVSAWMLASIDRYAFVTSDGSEDALGWGNVVGAAQYRCEGAKGVSNLSLSLNDYRSVQEMRVDFYELLEWKLSSRRDEITVSEDYVWKSPGPFKASAGGRARFAAFYPGKIAGEVNRKLTVTGSAYLQAGLETEKLELEGTFRPMAFRSDTTAFSVDVNLKGKWQFLPFLAVEATFDRMSQYYHILEGLPVGWSLDLQVPTTAKIPAESMMQGYAGLVAAFGHSTLSAGVYAKSLDNVIYFKDAQNFFDSSIASWEDEIDLGKGDSKGVELMYLFQGKELFVQSSLTVSKSTRWGFSEVNGGKPFHAPFDRRLVGSLSAEWKGAGITFTYQDGNWVNGRGESYTVLDQDGKRVELDYYSSVNNHQMPALIRLDVGYRIKWQKGPKAHELNLGVYNVLNHFNPFTVYYNTGEKTWKELELIPILPNLSYKVSF